MTSKIKLLKEIDYKKEIQVDRLIVDFYLINWQIKNIKTTRPNINDKELSQLVYDEVLKATKFQYLMIYLKDFFEFNISKEDADDYIKTHFNEKTIQNKNEMLLNQVKTVIQTQLILNYFIKEFKIEFSDKEAKDQLNYEYKKFNRSIHDILNNKNGAFDHYKQNELKSKAIDTLISKFKTNIVTDKIKTQITNALKQNAIFSQNIQFEGFILKILNDKIK